MRHQGGRILAWVVLFGLEMAAPVSYALSGSAVSVPVTLDSQPPAVRVTYPAGGETFHPTEVETLRWSIHEESFGVNPYPVVLTVVSSDSLLWSYSVNPGPDSSYVHPWVVVEEAAANARFIVSTTDDFGWSTADTSAGFRIVSGPTAVPAAETDLNPLGLVTSLHPNFPNPFNPATTLRFSLAAEAQFELAVFDLTGRRIADLAAGKWPAGRYVLPWSGSDAAGHQVASGVYLARLRVSTGGRAATWLQRLTLLK